MEKKSKKTSKRLNLFRWITSNIVYMLKDMNNVRMDYFRDYSNIDCVVVLSVGKKVFKKVNLTLTLLYQKWYNSTINN